MGYIRRPHNNYKCYYNLKHFFKLHLGFPNGLFLSTHRSRNIQTADLQSLCVIHERPSPSPNNPPPIFLALRDFLTLRDFLALRDFLDLRLRFPPTIQLPVAWQSPAECTNESMLLELPATLAALAAGLPEN